MFTDKFFEVISHGLMKVQMFQIHGTHILM